MHIKKLLIFLVIVINAYSLSVSADSKYVMETIGKHDDEVLGVFINSNNTKFATCSVDETIKIWSLPEGKELMTLTGHLGEVNNVSFSGDDQLLASGSTDNTVKIWDLNSGQCIKTLIGHTDQVIGVYFSQDPGHTFVASTSFDKTVKLWDVKLGTEIKTLHGHTASCNNVAYSYDGKFIASCGDDKKVILWSTDLTTKEPIKVFEGHESPVLTVIFSYDGKKLASSDQEGNIIVWSLPDGKILVRIKAHNDLIQDLSFAGDNIRLLSGSLDKKVKLWDTDTGDNLLDFDAGVEVWSVDLVNDAKIIVLACADGTVRLLKQTEEQQAKKPVKGGKKK